MKQEWTKFQAKVQSELYPLLNQASYKLQSAEQNEDNGGFVFMFEKDNTHRISIDVLERTTFEAGVHKDFNWLRVDIWGRYLKESMGTASETNMYLHDGWTWVTEEELDLCIKEITSGLKNYFDTRAE